MKEEGGCARLTPFSFILSPTSGFSSSLLSNSLYPLTKGFHFSSGDAGVSKLTTMRQKRDAAPAG